MSPKGTRDKKQQINGDKGVHVQLSALLSALIKCVCFFEQASVTTGSLNPSGFLFSPWPSDWDVSGTTFAGGKSSRTRSFQSNCDSTIRFKIHFVTSQYQYFNCHPQQIQHAHKTDYKEHALIYDRRKVTRKELFLLSGAVLFCVLCLAIDYYRKKGILNCKTSKYIVCRKLQKK